MGDQVQGLRQTGRVQTSGRPPFVKPIVDSKEYVDMLSKVVAIWSGEEDNPRPAAAEPENLKYHPFVHKVRIHSLLQFGFL
jgi:hypothetical protein